MLSDGRITRAEYEEAVQRLVGCAKEHGITVIPHDEFGLYVYELPGGDPDDVTGTCSEGTTITIEGLYSQMVQNPHREDMDELMAACFVRTGLVPRGYTADDYRRDSQPANGPSAEDAFPFDTADERFDKCNYNPSAQ